MSGAGMLIRENLKISRVQEQVLVGSLNLFSLIGSLASGKTSDSIGRRYTMALAAATFLAGAIPCPSRRPSTSSSPAEWSPESASATPS